MKQPVGISWRYRPGDKHFNWEATNIMRSKGLFVGDRLSTGCDSGSFAHTETAAWLAGPETPIDRLLVVHRTGSGKTSVMIRIFDEYFSDPRPKVAIFPNEEIVSNFYEKLLKTPNQYKFWAQAKSNAMNRPLTMNIFRDELAMKGMLHLRGRPGELASPMRPIRYSIAGGRQVFPGRGKKPENPTFKIDFDTSTGNPFSNKIILMDEVHNLVKPPQGTDKAVIKRLARIRDALYTAQNSIIIGLTATPFVENKEDGEELLKIIKGKENENSATNQGFVSYFNMLPSSIYPTMKEGAEAVKVIKIQLEGDNKQKYEKKMKAIQWSDKPDKKKDQLMNMMGYCNMAGYYTQASRMANQLRRNPAMTATKLDFIVRRAIERKGKSAILIHRKLGFEAIKKVIQGIDPENEHRFAFMGQPKSKRQKEDNPILAEFNDSSNYRGEKIRILVLDAETFGEGIDLIGVRYFYICNPAISYAQYKQWLGRVLRACAYHRLGRSERNVETELFVAVLSDRELLTADEMVYNNLKDETKEMEKAMHDVFGVPASDRLVLGHP